MSKPFDRFRLSPMSDQIAKRCSRFEVDPALLKREADYVERLALCGAEL